MGIHEFCCSSLQIVKYVWLWNNEILTSIDRKWKSLYFTDTEYAIVIQWSSPASDIKVEKQLL